MWTKLLSNLVLLYGAIAILGDGFAMRMPLPQSSHCSLPHLDGRLDPAPFTKRV